MTLKEYLYSKGNRILSFLFNNRGFWEFDEEMDTEEEVFIKTHIDHAFKYENHDTVFNNDADWECIDECENYYQIINSIFGEVIFDEKLWNRHIQVSESDSYEPHYAPTSPYEILLFKDQTVWCDLYYVVDKILSVDYERMLTHQMKQLDIEFEKSSYRYYHSLLSCLNDIKKQVYPD